MSFKPLEDLRLLYGLEISVTFDYHLVVPKIFCGIWGEGLLDSSGFHYYFIRDEAPLEIFKLTDTRSRDSSDLFNESYWPFVVQLYLHPDYNCTSDPDDVIFEFRNWLQQSLYVKK